MRCLLILLLYWSPLVEAKWVMFIPCGFAAVNKDPLEVPSGPAPHLGPFWVWAPAVTAILESKEPSSTGVWCSHMFVGSRKIFVIGTADVVRKALRKSE